MPDINFNNSYPNNEKINLTKYLPDEININYKNNYPGFLVIMNNFHPNWKAFVNGKETMIYRSNIAFQSIYLDKIGNLTITLKYQSYINLLSIISFISSIVILIIYFNYNKILNLIKI